VTITLSFLFSSAIFAHGMNKPGPHGGFIKMPGAYHTEVVNKDNKMLVYLIDMNFKNPMNTNSSVSVTYKGPKSESLECLKEKDYFVCATPKEGLKKMQELIVHSTRNNILASNAIYKLPLKLD
jgi:hypothetical protein